MNELRPIIKTFPTHIASVIFGVGAWGGGHPTMGTHSQPSRTSTTQEPYLLFLRQFCGEIETEGREGGLRSASEFVGVEPSRWYLGPSVLRSNVWS